RQGFLDLAGADPDRYLVVAAADAPEVVHAAVRERVAPLLPVREPALGQPAVVLQLQAAADAAAAIVSGDGAGAGMTHAWLFTGPPGSGRSVAARGFAAALQCEHRGCGHCAACHQSLAGTHADVAVVVPEGLSLGVAEVRRIVAHTA